MTIMRATVPISVFMTAVRPWPVLKLKGLLSQANGPRRTAYPECWPAKQLQVLYQMHT